MVRDQLSVLSAFLAVAEERSFTRAAKRLSVSTSALSHAIRGLEEQIGVRLLARTTRSVAPTEAGERLIARLRPALGDIRETLDEVASLKDRPVGRVRLLVPRFATRTELTVKLVRFAREYPEVVLDITTDDSRVDLVSSGFDAGIHIGEYIQRDMIAVRVSPDYRPAIVGSPEYFASHPVPQSPHDLVHHRCVNYRQGSAGVYHWEFQKDDQSLTLAVAGSLITDDEDFMEQAALNGVGLVFTVEQFAAPHLASGALVRVLEDWCQPFPGFFLYYPSRHHQPAALTALIATLRM
jgi:DNA-binding transcriptional LysR family regulator